MCARQAKQGREPPQLNVRPIRARTAEDCQRWATRERSKQVAHQTGVRARMRACRRVTGCARQHDNGK
eukprot:7628284-Alexandrium_andersonii.AAC.1